jgi:hypothetical protein
VLSRGVSERPRVHETDTQEWYITPTFRPIPHLLSPHEHTALSPFAYLVEALDLCGRSHTLQSQTIDPSDSRAVDRRRDSSVTLTSAAKRWFGDLPFKNRQQDAMTLMIVSSEVQIMIQLTCSKRFIMRELAQFRRALSANGQHTSQAERILRLPCSVER